MPPLPIGNTLHVQDRYQWREWLMKNHDKETEIWLVLPKKSSGKQRIPYAETVEEALCFGWIDSTVKKLDENHNVQRFTPRRKGSGYSQPNKESARASKRSTSTLMISSQPYSKTRKHGETSKVSRNPTSELGLHTLKTQGNAQRTLING